MIGNIIGDLAGSIYEFGQIRSYHPVKVGELIEENAFFSDDTILTMAVADAIVSNCSYEEKLKEYTLRYLNYSPNFKPYFKTAFSPSLVKWTKSDVQGTSRGNGAMMRVAPVGFLFNTEQEVKENAVLATEPSHNDDVAIKSAETIALIIFYARNGFSKKDIIKKLNLNLKEPTVTRFNLTCDETMDICLYSFFNSNSFNEAIKTAVSFGGDTDTNACIVGGMAEAMWGVTDSLKQKALKYIPQEFRSVLNNAYAKVQEPQR